MKGCEDIDDFRAKFPMVFKKNDGQMIFDFGG